MNPDLKSYIEQLISTAADHVKEELHTHVWSAILIPLVDKVQAALVAAIEAAAGKLAAKGVHPPDGFASNANPPK